MQERNRLLQQQLRGQRERREGLLRWDVFRLREREFAVRGHLCIWHVRHNCLQRWSSLCRRCLQEHMHAQYRL